MNLVIDIGNSSVKIGCFNEGKLIDPVRTTTVESLEEIVKKLNPTNIIVSTVATSAGNRHYAFSEQYSTLVLTHKTPLPVTIDYETPDTLGVDRIAAVVGASVRNPSGNSLVLDMGSCITYDLITEGIFFKGGIISPGLNLRFKAMHHFTKNLPLINEYEIGGDEVPLIGTSTKSAMISGALNGFLNEIDAFISLYKTRYPEILVFVCGGEVKFFENRLKASIFVVPELVLVGLNKILEFNIENETNK